MPPTGMSLNGGTLQLLPGGATVEQLTAAINDIINNLNAQLQTQVYSDTQNQRMLIGYQQDGWGPGNSFGVKISVAGKDVRTATDDELLFSLSVDAWTWRNSNGDITKQFQAETGTDSYYDSALRNYVNIGLRPSTGTDGFEMAKPGVDLGNEPI